MSVATNRSVPPALPGRRRWLSALVLSVMIGAVEAALVYLACWVQPPQQICYVPICVVEYESRAFAACVRAAGAPAVWRDSFPTAESVPAGATRKAILDQFDSLARRGSADAVVLFLSTLAIQADEGDVYLLPGDAKPDEPWTWIRLRDLLVKLRACPTRHKLLVLDLTPVASARLGSVRGDIAEAIPLELQSVPDADRWVLTSHSSGEASQVLADSGISVFTYYFLQALGGGIRAKERTKDGPPGVSEVAAFTRQRVGRWSMLNRGRSQTPMLVGKGADFAIGASADGAGVALPASQPREYPAWLTLAWRQRDAGLAQGRDRMMPRLFQQQQAMLLAAEEGWRAGASEAWQRQQWLAEYERIHDAMQRAVRDAPPDNDAFASPVTGDAAARKTFAEWWRRVHKQIASEKPGDIERIKKHAVEEIRAKLSDSELDGVVFSHVLAEGKLDPGSLRLYNRILHSTAQTAPRTARTLRLKQLADLAMRVEVFAWPTEVVDTLLRATEIGETALTHTSGLPGYQMLLEEPMRHRHAGEIRVWVPGYASSDDARQELTMAIEQFERLLKLSEQWQRDKQLLDEALVELPTYRGALESLPTLRAAWQSALTSARHLADTLQPISDDAKKGKASWNDLVGLLATRNKTAQAHARELRQHLQNVREPFSKDELTRLENQCRTAHADASVLQRAHALLSACVPSFRAEDRVSLTLAAGTLARRLHMETAALDRLDSAQEKSATASDVSLANAGGEQPRAEWRARQELMLLELAGVGEPRLRLLRMELDRCINKGDDAGSWCELGIGFRRLIAEELPREHRQEVQWHRRTRLATALSPFDRRAGLDDDGVPLPIQAWRNAKQRQERWNQEWYRYLASDFLGVNFESEGIAAARAFYAGNQGQDVSRIRLRLAAPLEPLARKTPYAHAWLEVTRQVPPGEFGGVELKFHRPDDRWLAIAPESATLPELRFQNDPRTLSHKVPLKVTRKLDGERSGLSAPLGFLVEARFEGRTWHHLVTTPIPRDGHEVQILVSADAKEPETTVSEIRLRPGKSKQPHYVFLKNLTNRPVRIHVDVSETSAVLRDPAAPNPLLLAEAPGEKLLFKSTEPLTLAPDGVHKIPFFELAGKELRGLLQVRVLNQQRDRVLEMRTIRVGVLQPHEYVKVGEVRYAPGAEGEGKWIAQIEPAKRLTAGTIAAELVLPTKRIPNLLAVGGGTLRVELPTHLRTPQMLFAEKIQLRRGNQEGPVYLNIDGVPRAFVFNTTFTRQGAPMEPTRDEQPAVRLLAPTAVMAGVQCLVDIEVDNAPAGAKLEVALGRTEEGSSFKAEATRAFPSAKDQRIVIEGAKDALVFEASIKDWTATFDTKSILGARTLRARLLDQDGKEIAVMTQPIVIDDTPPIARLAPIPQAKRGTKIELRAEASDVESGIAQVVFFVGPPDKGEVPPGAVRVKATASATDPSTWLASLALPADHKGPLPIGVQVVNHAGMASLATITVDVIEPTVVKAVTWGRIRGKVVEGPRPQPNLIVTLTDERGKEIARTRTGPDGTYGFEQIPPGRYRLLCVKPESQRRAIQGVTVDPERMSQADLSLSL